MSPLTLKLLIMYIISVVFLILFSLFKQNYLWKRALCCLIICILEFFNVYFMVYIIKVMKFKQTGTIHHTVHHLTFFRFIIYINICKIHVLIIKYKVSSQFTSLSFCSFLKKMSLIFLLSFSPKLKVYIIFSYYK